MTSTSNEARGYASTAAERASASERPLWQRIPGATLALTALLLAFVLIPPVRGHAGLTWTFVGVAGALLGWQALLLTSAGQRARGFLVEFVPPLKSHYVQGSIQLSIYAYWGWYWPKVYEAAPLIVAQMVFFYAFDALLAWSRGREWRLGFGPVPIIFSVNLFLWFKDDWFAFQFVMLAICALAKEFLRWNRDGKRTHIFNPSAFGLAAVSVVLIATKTTHLTWGVEVATTLALPPYIYVWIFVVGLVVQYFFAVTLMTLSAVAVLVALNAIYTRSTDLYFFIDTNIPIAIFLGLHLLVTDPSTSPRSNAGRIVFGALYGAANWVLFDVLGRMGVPDFYDKLLPVPILNLLVPVIDRLARNGPLAAFTRWESRFTPRKLNYVHMGCWVLLFAAMRATDFVGGPHEGASIAFWKRAYDEGKPGAGEKLFKMVGNLSDMGSAGACNELGVMYLEGKNTKRNPDAAAYYFAKACALGSMRGCENLAWQHLFFGKADSPEAAAFAVDAMERECGQREDGRSCFLIGYAYESGIGRTADPARALELYRAGFARGNLDACKGLARLTLRGAGSPDELASAAAMLERACQSGDAQSCLFLAYLAHDGRGVPADEPKAVALLTRACELGSQEACAALARTDRWVDLAAPSGGR